MSDYWTRNAAVMRAACHAFSEGEECHVYRTGDRDYGEDGYTMRARYISTVLGPECKHEDWTHVATFYAGG